MGTSSQPFGDPSAGALRRAFAMRLYLIGLALGVLLSLPLAGCSGANRDFTTTVTCVGQPNSSRLTIDKCVINRPEVRAPLTSYAAQVQINQGDVVDISAQGCVQRGGSGLSTYRYADPSGPGSDHLYFGSHWLKITGPHANVFPQRRFLANGQSWEYTVPVGAHAELWLGYADKDGAYGDNGYYSEDAGPNNQCSGEGDASVVVGIVRSGLPPVQALVTPPPACTMSSSLAILPRVADANVVGYGEVWPPLPPAARLLSIQNASPVAVSLIARNHTLDAACFNAAGSKTLNPQTSRSGADLSFLYGSNTPPLPVPLLACVAAGGSPPNVVTLVMTTCTP
jgi:hypothetical protein